MSIHASTWLRIWPPFLLETENLKLQTSRITVIPSQNPTHMRNPQLRLAWFLYLLCLAFSATALRGATVATLPATGITTSSATLNGFANAGGSFASGFFQYGTTTNYGTTTGSQSLGSGSTNFSQVVTGLTGGQAYHFRAAINTVFSNIFGADQAFFIPAAPTVTTLAASSLHPGEATLNATVNPNSLNTTCWFQHGPTTSYGSFTPTNTLAAGTRFVAISSPLTGLPRGVVYHFRVVASNPLGQSTGADMSFTVPPGATGPSGTTGGGTLVDIRQPALELNYIICTNGIFPGGGVVGVPLLGSICLFAGNFAPAGWALCQGQLLNTNADLALFSLIGTEYGGDGLHTFALPDLRGQRAVDAGTGLGLMPWVIGQEEGVTQEALLLQQIPAHTHSLPPPDSLTGTNGGGQPRNNVQPSLAVTYSLVPAGIFPTQGGATIFEPFLGQVLLYAGNSAPDDSLLVGGQLEAINQFEALFALMGTNYGGNGQTTFALPDLRSRVPLGNGQGPITLWSLGQGAGVENVKMTQAQMPAHQHTVPSLGIMTGLTGGNQPQTNFQPSLALQCLISTNGQIPSATVEATNEMLGEIQLYAGTNLPGGWLPCDGRSLPISGNAALFGVISNFYGGDGVTTFALPNLSGRVAVGSANGQPGAVYGAEQTVLTVAQLPPHTHTVPVLDFDRWITSFGLSGAAAGFSADADTDDADNGYEWATGTNPTNAQSLAALTIHSVGSNVMINFPRNTNATDVVFTVQRSTNVADAGAWTGFATNVAGVWNPPAIVTETGVTNPVNVSVSDTRTNAPAAGYRLQITWP